MNCEYETTCPNCGRSAQRIFVRDSNVVRTQCSSCDYLLVLCSETGRVIETYSPGMYVVR
ncbi:MAG: replication restart DNA helicase PriA [Geitlerinemataceae cyanobacterium]